MKKYILYLIIILSVAGCENKSKLSHVIAEQIFMDKSDPYRHKKAIDYLNDNWSTNKKKYRDTRILLGNAIRDEYDSIETKQFLLKYGKTKVAFVESFGKIFIMNLDGTEKEQITSYDFDHVSLYVRNIRWSPNGKYLVCNSRNDGSWLLLINTETKEKEWLTKNSSDSWPTWSPDSKKVLFYRDDIHSVVSINIKTKKETIIFKDAKHPPLFPFYLKNGEDIAFNRNLQFQILREGEIEPKTLIEPDSIKDKTTLSSLLSVGSFEYSSISNKGDLILVDRGTPEIFDLKGKSITKIYGRYCTWGYGDEYILYQTSQDGIPGYGVTPVYPDKNKLSTYLFIGFGNDAAWSPTAPQ